MLQLHLTKVFVHVFTQLSAHVYVLPLDISCRRSRHAKSRMVQLVERYQILHLLEHLLWRSESARFLLKCERAHLDISLLLRCAIWSVAQFAITQVFLARFRKTFLSTLHEVILLWLSVWKLRVVCYRLAHWNDFCFRLPCTLIFEHVQVSFSLVLIINTSSTVVFLHLTAGDVRLCKSTSWAREFINIRNFGVSLWFLVLRNWRDVVYRLAVVHIVKARDWNFLQCSMFKL